MNPSYNKLSTTTLYHKGGKKMPLGKGVRYRWKVTKGGKKIRLAFKGNKVIEVKKKGGQAHMVKGY
jgi:hypothetical protein